MARKISRSKELQITLEGGFFERDPRKTFRANIRDMMAALATETEKAVADQLRFGQAGRFRLGGGIEPGRTAAHVRGRVVSLSGKPWEVSAVVSMNTNGLDKKQAIKLQAAASYLEGRYHPFRRTAAAVRRSRAVLAANLTKGLE